MPPDPLPWERKDFFKERKHGRSSSDSLGGGGGGGGGGGSSSSFSRWRETHHGLSRWGSAAAAVDVRRPPGHGKQGGWHLSSEESGHGFSSSRSNDKILDEEGHRSSVSRGDGKYCRNNLESKGSFGHKDWRCHSWEPAASPSGPGRPSDMNDQRSVDDALACNSHPHSDFVNTWDPVHLKDHHDKISGVNDLSTGRRHDGENSLGSIDWKPLKWTRSGSLSLHNSGFSHSSSSKSMGVDLGEMKVDMQPRIATLVQSPSGDAAACVTFAASSEETSSRKKPRLGWGEGLAKYEKKKVDGPDDGAARNGVIGNADLLPSYGSNLEEKSPRIAGFSDCTSPATPSSVACSSSPGLEDKTYARVLNVDNDNSNLSGSPSVVDHNQSVTLPFNLENLELTQLAKFSSPLAELLQSDDMTSPDSGFVSSTAMNKLLIWKGDISKALEITESEIDMLENELKSLISQTASSCPCPATYSSLPVEGHIQACEELGSASNVPFVSNEGVVMEDKLQSDDKDNVEVKGEGIESPGTVTSRFVEPLRSRKDDTPFDRVNGECSGDSDANRYKTIGEKYSVHPPDERLKEGDSHVTVSADVSSDHSRGNILFDFILAANKDSANRASEVLHKLLPSDQGPVDISRIVCSSCCEIDSVILEKFARRRRFLKFKERAIVLKFRAFQHHWKEDMHLLSLRKYRAKSQKKFESSLRPGYGSFQKHQSSIRSRYSCPAGNLSLVPNVETTNHTSKLLSDSQVKLCRNTLKMPAMVLDKKEKTISRFVSSNGLVEDPCAVERERSMINPWTKEEKEIFMEKLSTYGKDFAKIASFLDHKTTADCVEFYYRNHKSDCFDKAKKKPELTKQGRSHFTNTYLVTSGKRWNREVNAASLDMLGAASAIAAGGDDDLKYNHKGTSKFYFADYKAKCDDAILERSSSHDIFDNDIETVAADVLAGICGSLSSEALSSCITSSVDPGEGCPDWKSGKVGSTRRPLTPDVTQGVDDETCSDESCGEMDPSDWTDEEKSLFIQAVSSYGKDFAMIARCVRTKSRNQCKIFFSKARKCLGLDMIHTAHGGELPLLSDDNNRGGDDTEDECVVEADSAICSDKSGLKMDEDLPVSGIHGGCDEADPSSATDLQTDINCSDRCHEAAKLDCKDTELGAKNMVPDDCRRDMEIVLNSGGNTLNCSNDESAAVPPGKNEVIASCSEAGQDDTSEQGTLEQSLGTVEADEHGLGTVNSVVGTNALSEVAAHNSGTDLVEQKHIHEHGLGTVIAFVGTNASGEVSIHNSGTDLVEQKLIESQSDKLADKTVGSTTDSTELNFQSAVNTSQLTLDTSLSSGVGDDPRNQHKTALGLDASQNSCVTSLLQENHYVLTNSASHDSAATYIENISTCNVPPTHVLEVSDQLCQRSSGVDNHHKHVSESSLLPSQILKGYPLPMSSREMNGNINCKKEGPLKGISKLDRSFHSDRYLSQDCFLQKCNSSKHHSSVAELPLLSREQVREHSRPPSQGMERPCRNGDVKLFGQILSHPSSQQKSAHDNKDSSSQHPKLSGRSFNLKFNGNHGVDGNSGPGKFDHNNYLGFENFSMRSSQDFWDGNRIQSGFSSLPDSAVLLAKYPAAFGNYPTSSSRLDHQPLHTVVNSNEHPVNRLSVFPSREVSSSNGVADFQMYGSRDGSRVQPFTLEMNKRQDLPFSEMQRRNSFESASIQQQARGIGGMNVVGRGGVFVGGPCTGFSDPVAALRMHYAKAENYSGQTGGLIREEERRGKEDINR